jgi:hypothetical protein
MKKLLFLWVGILLALAGCTSVSSTKPVGLPIWAELQGTWLLEMEGAHYFHVWLRADGSLQMAKIEWNEESQSYQLVLHDLVLSTDDGAFYLNIDDPATSGGPPKYGFFRAVPSTGDTVILIPPQTEHFASAVKTGELKGEFIEGDGFGEPDIHLTDAKQLEEFIHPDKFLEQFDLESAMTIRRLQASLGPIRGPTAKYQGRQDHMQCLPAELVAFAARPNSMESVMRKAMQGAGPEELERERSKSAEERRDAPSITRECLVSNGIVVQAELTTSEFSAYQQCLEARGYKLVGVPYEETLWVTRNGLGLFTFQVTAKSAGTDERVLPNGSQ